MDVDKDGVDDYEGGDNRSPTSGSSGDYQHEGGGADVYEGGKKKHKQDQQHFNPFDLVQHPSAYPRKPRDRVPDTRVFELYKRGCKLDLLFVRLPLILGNTIMCAAWFIGEPASQLYVQVLECIAISTIVMFCQWNIWRHWDEYRLDMKMKDNKANYLFISPKAPNQLQLDKRDADGAELMPEWNKYMHFYKFRDIFLDNKLEELLNIFGRRQCKSCCDFDTGTKPEPDPRKIRSWPLSPRGEAEYQGMAGDFDLIDFQLADNVYHEV
jgi:hypothetical protein